MTREEAYDRIDAIIAKHEIDDVYVTITNYKDYDALRIARKLLEQESILDKIKSEINSPNRGNCDYFIVDRIEEIINEHTELQTESEGNQ